MSAPPATVTQTQMLKLGTVLSKGDESPDAPFFLEEDNGENAETFEVKAEQIATGRTCVIGSSGCIPETEYFYTRNGVIPVSDVYDGMPSHNGYVHNIEKKKGRIYRVLLHGQGRGSIEFIGSDEHPILVSLPCHIGLVRGKIPKNGNHFGHGYHEHQRWITIKELFEKQYRFAYGRFCDADFINVKTISIGKELAKLFGYLMSDGSWSVNQSVKFTNVRESFLQDVESLANGFGLITKRISKGNGFDVSITHQNGHNRFAGHLLLDSITNLEISSHSDTFGKLQLLENAELIEFLKGYFNGDGNLTFILDGRRHRPVMQMRFYVGENKRQAIELQFMLWRLGVYSSVKRRLREKGVKGCWEVVVCQSSTKRAARLLKDIKYPEIFDKVIAEADPPIENNLGVPYSCDRNWMRIRKVEYLGETTVVGWESNPDHQIISYGGLVTHNSGKSYTVAVICEELCKNKVPFVIVDVEGEYSGLKERYEVIWLGDDEACDLRWKSKVDLKQLAKFAPDSPPIVFDLSETYRPREKVNEFLIELYREISRRRTPYLVILEEADRFSPQVGDRLPIFDEIARRGRKRGVGLMLCTQRPSLVDKNILSQCSNQLIGKLVIKNDLNAVAQFFAGRGPPNQLTGLSPGEFFALGGMAPQPEKVKIRPRETRHGGITPKLNPTTMQASVEKMLEAIQTGGALHTELMQPDRTEVEPEIVAPEEKETAPAVMKVEEVRAIVVPKEEEEATEVSAPLDQETSPAVKHQENQRELSALLEEEEEEQQPPFVINPVAMDSDPSKILGLAPSIQPEAVPGLVKLVKTYKLFGKKENVTDVALVFRPIIEVGVRIRSGVLRKKFETKFFLLDGMSGKLAEVTDRLTVRRGTEKLLSLSESQVEVLKALLPDRDLSLIEIAGAANKESEETRRFLKALEDRRLVRSTKLGRAKGYRRLLDIPRIELFPQPLLRLNELNPSDGFKLSKLKIKEAQVREVVKGLWEGADVDSFRQIYYPVYVAEILLEGRTRHVWLDGRTGQEIEI